MHSNKKSTFAEIAKIAGVSPATVSRIITNTANVKTGTKQKVLNVMNQLGYDTAELLTVPHTENSGLLLLNIPTIKNPFYSLIVQGAKSAATRHGYELLINESHINSTTINNMVSIIKKTKIAGLIITNHVTSEFLLKLNSLVPVVQCCEYDEGANLPYVAIDDITSTKMVMNYIFSTGRRKIAFINGPIRYKYARNRLEGYLSSLRSKGLTIDNDLIIQLPDISFDMAVAATMQLLRSSKCPDAFYTISDVFAAAVIKAANQVGLKVPDDIIVVGFDNLDISSISIPTITTVNQPEFQLGFLSCDILVERIVNPEAPIRTLTLDTELIIRESTTLAE